MNRRWFLKALAAIPLVRHIPLPKSVFGSGADGDVVLTGKMLSPYQWYGYRGGGGCAGGCIVVIKCTGVFSVSANGGSGGAGLTQKGGNGGDAGNVNA